MITTPVPPLPIVLVDLSGESTVRYLPLGILYIKAALTADPLLADRTEVTAKAFLAGTSIARMTTEIVEHQPRIVGFSCQGWNVRIYEQLIPTLRQLLPQALIVLGGNHVSDQGDRWLRRVPAVDVVVNGEGETAMCQIVRAHLGDDLELSAIPGITFRDGTEVTTTTSRPRAASMDDVPSPFLLDGLVPGRADVVLWETNRGCPYHCAFCHWGGAVGQKITRARLDRLRDELEVMARAGAPAIFICDANFGILPQDVDIARMVVDVRRRYGALGTLHVNWAKNHAGRVGEVLDILQAGNVRTNVYLALQTLETEALTLAGRDERGRSAMMDLAGQILDRDGEVGAELIFGLPGETLAQFRSAYDTLSQTFPTLLVHPLWILPNTTYDQDRTRFGLVTIRPDPTVDYEGILEHRTLPLEDNRAGLRLLLADDILIGSGYARTTLRGLARWGSLRSSEVLDEFADFVMNRPGPLAAQLADVLRVVREECYFHRYLRGRVRSALFADRVQAHSLLDAFITQLDIAADVAAACRVLARYDCALLPRADLTDHGDVDEVHDLDFDAHRAARELLSSTSGEHLPPPCPVTMVVRHRTGFARHRDDPIDLSASWRGSVVAIQPKSLVPR